MGRVRLHGGGKGRSTQSKTRPLTLRAHAWRQSLAQHVSYKDRPADRVRVAQKKECAIDMITNVRTYGHRTGMCIHSHTLRATEIPVTADNMGWSSKGELSKVWIGVYENCPRCNCLTTGNSNIH